MLASWSLVRTTILNKSLKGLVIMGTKLSYNFCLICWSKFTSLEVRGDFILIKAGYDADWKEESFFSPRLVTDVVLFVKTFITNRHRKLRRLLTQPSDPSSLTSSSSWWAHSRIQASYLPRLRWPTSLHTWIWFGWQEKDRARTQSMSSGSDFSSIRLKIIKIKYTS